METSEEFIRKKLFPSKGITDESWEKFKIEHSGTNWIEFAINSMQEFAIHKNKELLKALDGLINSNYGIGCPMCDNGKLRNNEKQHWDDCNWNNASRVYEKNIKSIARLKKDSTNQ